MAERRVRRTARVVLIDDLGRVLLFQYHDAGAATHPHNRAAAPLFWATAGGGVNDGESFEDGARRELWEETGIAEVELGPCVWTRQAPFAFLGEPILAVECYFVARCAPGEITIDNFEELERSTYRGHRWWSVEELRASEELIFPIGLAELVAPLVDGKLPRRPIVIK